MPETHAYTGFKFEGVMIERIIVHRIYSHTPDKQLVKPKTSSKLIKFEQAALDALQLRVTKALGNRSHGIEMSIERFDTGSFFQNSSTMLHADDGQFIAISKELADSLNKAQLSTTAPGGMLAIISGRVGNDALPFIASIKAETQDGFKANEHDDQVDMEYISEVLLTDTQRFYKIGFLVELATKPAGLEGYLPGNYRAFLFDHLMTSTETKSAAGYFFSGFLGMGIQASAKKLTQDFFELTRKFIDTSLLEQHEKFECFEALRVELRSQDATISIAAFGDKHLTDDLRKQYESFMKAQGFPQNAVTKDNTYIQAKLKRRRKLLFTSDVWLSTPSDEFKNLVQVLQSEDAEFTMVKIKGLIKGQE